MSLSVLRPLLLSTFCPSLPSPSLPAAPSLRRARHTPFRSNRPSFAFAVCLLAAARIQQGDILAMVTQEGGRSVPVAGLPISQVLSLLTGNAGTSVKLHILDGEFS